MKSSKVTSDSTVARFISDQQNKDLLRFIVCGSVDDGKSTMIGRLLYDSQQIFDDQLASLANDSLKHGTQGDSIDFALLTDGLQAEREQGITIDVAYRFFATDKRSFIVVDAPGHEQYTRNMVTGASTAELAVVLIDARKGVLPQTRRHSLIVNLLGIKNVIVAINKVDLVGYSQEIFDEIAGQYRDFAGTLNFENIHFVPICALTGENLSKPSENMPWYTGPRVIDVAETMPVGSRGLSSPFRMSVQSVNRPNADFRGYMGTIASGKICVGDPIRVLPGGIETRIKAFADFDGPRDSAIAGESVCLVLEDEIDISRGDLLSSVIEPVLVSDHFEAKLVWMADEDMVPHHSYILKMGSKEVRASVDTVKHRVDINTGERLPASTLCLNDIAMCAISTVTPIAFDLYDANRGTGSFVLIDRTTNRTIAAGMVRHNLRRSENVQWQEMTIGREQREVQNEQKGFVVWLTGLSGSGKTTLANAIESVLHQRGIRTYVLDGDNVRHGLSADLSFTDADRAENIRRIAEVAKLFVDAGMVTIVSVISPFQSERALAREIIGESDFFEVFVSAPIEVVEHRDPKGLYAKARSGALPNFTGVDSPYEAPEHPDLVVETSDSSIETSVQLVLQTLSTRGWFDQL